jgi:hypothetical protein
MIDNTAAERNVTTDETIGLRRETAEYTIAVMCVIVISGTKRTLDVVRSISELDIVSAIIGDQE